MNMDMDNNYIINNDNIYLLEQPIELQNEISNYLPLNKLINLNEVCVKLNDNVDIKTRISNLKFIITINIINDWYLHSYESRILKNIVKKLYENDKINKEIYNKLNTNSVYEFDKSIGWGIFDLTPNVWSEIYNTRDIEWSYNESNFLRDYYNIYGPNNIY